MSSTTYAAGRMSKNDPIRSYEEFWPFYLSQHSRPRTRQLHVFGTSLGLVLLVAAIAYREPGLLLLALLTGYGFAWFAHTFIEKNRPATFSYPLWSVRGDLHMLCLWVSRRLEAEVLHQKLS